MAVIQQFDYSVDLMKVLLWQYNDAEKLQLLMQQKQDWYTQNQSRFWMDWFVDVFDLSTANDFGLQVWAIILNIPLVVTIDPSNDVTPSWAFGDLRENFEHSNFHRQFAGAQQLTTEQARLVLRLRYFQLTTRGAIAEINNFLHYLFFEDYGNCFVIDLLDMTCQYTFNFALPSALRFIFERYDILPRPAGVGVNILVVATITWGFDEYHENYDNGNFSEL